MAEETEFSAEDEARFAALGEDDQKEIERYRKWLERKKAQAGPSSAQSPPGLGTLTLGQLKELIADQTNSSILRHLLAQEEASQATQAASAAKKKTAPSGGGLANLLKR